MFEPLFNKNYNCLDIALANVTRFFQKDHELMFLGAWGFRFSDNENLPMGKRLKTDWQCTREYLSLFHGIQSVMTEISEPSVQQDIIFAELQDKKAVVVKMDAYKCKWNLAYSRYHIPHYFVIVDINKNKYKCIDTYSSEYEEYLESSEIFDAIYTFQCHTVTNESVISNAKKILGSNDFLHRIVEQQVMIENFANEIVNIDYDSIASLAKDVWASPICRKIKEIGCGRKNFLLALIYLEKLEIASEISEIKTGISTIASDWDKIYRLIIKVSFLQDRDSSLNKIKDLLKGISGREKQIAEKIVSNFD